VPNPVPIAPIPGLNEAIAKTQALRDGAALSSSVPLVPAWALALAATLAAVLVPASAVLPFPYSAAAGIAALVCAFLAGVPLPAPSFSHPLIPLVLVPVALQVGGGLAVFASTLTSPAWHSIALLGSAVCFALAGKALPVPQQPPPAP
jgi:hypothetical protein